MINVVDKACRYLKRILSLDRSMEKVLLNQGKILSGMNDTAAHEKLSDYEWKIFSEWGEDGIIDFLVSEVDVANKTFIEFGVEDFSESNCRFLMMNRNWQGFIIDQSAKHIETVRSLPYYWRHDLQLQCAFVTRENINELLSESGFDRDLGLLSIDIDGNDYHILEAIDVVEPRILICEFNGVFGTERAITVPYDPAFNRTKKHYSNLYFGASIAAFENYLSQRAYTLVGTGLFGGNAFFVKTALMTEKLTRLAKSPYCFAFNHRTSRDRNGKLSFLRGDARLNEIRGLDVVNTITGQIEPL